ncbi:hypothetical protein M8818_003809 [Zalaria obscura]|uniref:Uncharacterized protein n=1 Tax=Zalaria obscura TaxID=2024903 RepID=A0ACC3SDH0_9PEZI
MDPREFAKRSRSDQIHQGTLRVLHTATRPSNERLLRPHSSWTPVAWPMAFRFSIICDLLSRLEDIASHDPPLIPADRLARTRQETQLWFKSHRRTIDSLDARSTKALLSTLFPERRTDRVYSLQSTSLYRLLCRSLGLSATRAQDLGAYRQPGNGDLAACLERVLTGGGPPALPIVTVEELDDCLHDMAGQSQFSGPSVRQLPSSSNSRSTLLANLFQRMQPVEAKWLVRLLLKDFSPVLLEEKPVLGAAHFLLPDLLRLQENFDAAVDVLKGPLGAFPSRPDPQSEVLLREVAASKLRPSVGVKISRSDFVKGRSIDHCLKMMGKYRWMVERKYDGEYCEIHIDLSRGADWLKIYSKNFYKIRKHVTRSGVSLGTEKDSQRSQSEHLMIVFFDLLLLDDSVIMNKPLEDRKALLNSIYLKKHGRAMTAESKVLDFADPGSKERLVKHFAASMAARCEGLLLKPCGVPYFSIGSASTKDRFVKTIKLKKDYIAGLGDEADFAVVGASYSAQAAQNCAMPNTRWTHFHLGCLTNKDEVIRLAARARFRIVGTIAHQHCIPVPVLASVNGLGYHRAEPYDPVSHPTCFDIDADRGFRMDVTFREPFIFEVLGSSFDKPSNCDFYMLRHPRVRKLHQDRPWQKCISFEELQQQAKEALSSAPDSESQETLRWIDRLEESCKRKYARMSCNTTPCSKATTVSPVMSRKQISPKAAPTVFVGDTDENRPPTPTLSKPDRRSIAAAKAPGPSPKKGLLPTPPISSPPPVHSPQRRSTTMKRYSVEGPETSRKRRCLSTIESSRDKGLPTQTNLTIHKAAAPHRSPPSSPSLRKPLSDITERPHQRANIMSQQSETNHLVPIPSRCAFRNSLPCGCAECGLSDAVVYLYPPSSDPEGKNAKQAQLHGAEVIEHLAYWDRDSFAYPILTATVSESQAYAGMTKIVLVDMADEEALTEVVGVVKGLNYGHFREDVMFYDVSLLQIYCKSGGGDDGTDELPMTGFFLGALSWDTETEQSVFTAA